MIEAVFFDVGETLLRPHPSFAELFAEICSAGGAEVTPSDVKRVQEALAPHLVDIAEDTGVINPTFSDDASRRFWTYLYTRFVEELGLVGRGLEERLYERFSDRSSYLLFDDVVPTLDVLEGRYRLGIISNFESWLAERLVELEIGHRFEVVVISGIDLVEKPDPGIYELALGRMGVAPDRAVHVGDSLSLDVRPSAGVGMRPVLLDRAGRYPEPPCPRVTTLEDLPHLIAKL